MADSEDSRFKAEESYQNRDSSDAHARARSFIDESTPLIQNRASQSSKSPFRRHDSLPCGQSELTKSGAENQKVKLRKLGTFSYISNSYELNENLSSMRLLNLHREDEKNSDTISSKAGSSSLKKETKIAISESIDDDDDDCIHAGWTDSGGSSGSSSSLFSNSQFFGRLDLPVKLPKFGVFKVIALSFLVVYTIIAFMVIAEKKEKWRNIVIAPGESVYYDLSHSVDLFFPDWSLKARGAFLPEEFRNLSGLTMAFSVVQFGDGDDKNNYRLITQVWDVPIAPPELVQYLDVEVGHTFRLSKEDAMKHTNRFYLRIDTNSEVSVAVRVSVFAFSELHRDNILISGFVLLFLYILLLFELVHRTLAAMLGATAAIACLTLVRNRPSLEKVVSWLDVETLSLLFGMMLKVAILVETGFFDYIAIYAFRLTRGRTWPLIFTLCCFTAVLSAFLDNVTTMLLMTPITIRLCEIKNIDPKHVLIALVIFSNIGGAATPVGDPPNVIIISSAKIKKLGVDFGRFTMHMLPGVICVFLAILVYIRYVYKDLSKHDRQTTVANQNSLQNLLDSGRHNHCSRQSLDDSATDHDCPAILSSDDLKREIAVWKKALNSISGYSRDESKVMTILNKKVKSLEKNLKDRKFETIEPEDNYDKLVEILQEKYKIKDMPLFIKCACIFSVALSLFFSVSFFPGVDLSLGWIAILCSQWMLVIYDKKDLDSIFARIEWSTLIFFAALFVVMEALNELGFLEFIGDLTQIVINSAPQQYRLIVAILLFTWVSAASSAFIDNIPLTTMMVKVIEEFSENNESGIPLVPLVYALAMGACLGGNATLIGASANVVCAGVAQQHGYGFSFFDFSRVGTPVAFISVTIASIYLIICHVVFEWNY